MNITLLGYGSMGRRHAHNARSLGHEVVVQDTDSTRMAEAASDGFATDTNSGWRTDRLIVATPASEHAKWIWAARVPVLVEKPLALSLRDYWRESTGPQPRVPVRVGYQFRFHPHVRQLKAWVQALPTPPKHALFRLSCDMVSWPGSAYADALGECSHEIDLAGHLFGTPTCVYAKSDPAQLVWAIDLLCGETFVQFKLNAGAKEPERWAHVSPTGATEAEDQCAWWGWNAQADISELRLPLPPELSRDVNRLIGIAESVYCDEMRAFLDGTWEQSGGCSLAEGIGVLRTCDQAHEKARMEAVARG